MPKKMELPIVNFSLSREVFFVVVGSIIGGAIMHLSRILLDIFGNASYLTTLLVAARVVGSSAPEVGLGLHFLVSTIIGIVTGVFLHKAIKFNISKVTHGATYGVIVGVLVFVVFAIPVSQLLLVPNLAHILVEFDSSMTFGQATEHIQQDLLTSLVDSLVHHIIWGVTLGIIGSLLTRKWGANYLCYKCNVEFSKIHTYYMHQKHVHQDPSPNTKHILILGGGYAGVNVLNSIQQRFENDVNISISLVSESNFFLHTPMLPEMATGTIESRHIATPIRNFCRRARFYQSKVTRINLDEKTVTILKSSGAESSLSYDYLVLAMGSRSNFFGNKNIAKHAFTIKTLDDAIKIRNHIIAALEDADQEEDKKMQSKLCTFVIVGGGFSGVETAGEINDFVRESAQKFYRNIDPELIKVILVSARDGILPEIGGLGTYAKEALERAGVTIYTKTKLADASEDLATLDNKKAIPYSTLIWAGGIVVDEVIASLDTEHYKDRVVVDEYLRLKDYANVYALGDCASVMDTKTGTPYPPTAQHAIRQAKTVSENLTLAILHKTQKLPFTYDSKGSMAKIGKKDGVALLLGREFRGIVAWFIWKQYYLSTLPTLEKKIRVGLDWFVDLFFARDITRL